MKPLQMRSLLKEMLSKKKNIKQLQYENQQTYLGVTFDKRMTWTHHVKDAEAKARRKIIIIRKHGGNTVGSQRKDRHDGVPRH